MVASSPASAASSGWYPWRSCDATHSAASGPRVGARGPPASHAQQPPSVLGSAPAAVRPQARSRPPRPWVGASHAPHCSCLRSLHLGLVPAAARPMRCTAAASASPVLGPAPTAATATVAAATHERTMHPSMSPVLRSVLSSISYGRGASTATFLGKVRSTTVTLPPPPARGHRLPAAAAPGGNPGCKRCPRETPPTYICALRSMDQWTMRTIIAYWDVRCRPSTIHKPPT